MIKDLKKLASNLDYLGCKKESSIVRKLASNIEKEEIPYEGNIVTFYKQDLITNNHEYYGKYPVLVKDTDGNDHYIYAEF